MIRLDITPGQRGMRTTECIAQMLPELQRYNLKKVLKAGEIRLNGSRISKDFEVSEGDVIEVYTPVEFERVPSLDVCYEDRNFIILNKQPGTLVMGEAGKKTPDLLSMVINHMKDTGEYSEQAGYIPFPCYKLDAYTGGLVIFAKNGDMFEMIREAIQQRRVKRLFKAIIKGCPREKTGQLQHFYIKEGENKYRISNKKINGAVPIYTKYNIIRSNGKFSLVDIEPVTQHIDQERIHMEAAGFPILGDPVYGDNRLNKKMGITHQALWASAIEFTTGVNNMLEYLNGKQVYTDDINFPIVDY